MDSPHCRLLHLGTQQQIGEKEDVPNLPGAFRHFHQEAILHQLTGLRERIMSLLVVPPKKAQGCGSVALWIKQVQKINSQLRESRCIN